MCSKSPCFPPISFYILATTLSHLIPARPLVTFSHTTLLAMVGNLSFGTLIISTFSPPHLISSGYIPSFAFNTVLLVVLEHPSTVLSGFICSVRGGGCTHVMHGVLICCVPCCSHLIIDHALLPRRSTVPTPNSLQYLGARYVFFHSYVLQVFFLATI